MLLSAFQSRYLFVRGLMMVPYFTMTVIYLSINSVYGMKEWMTDRQTLYPAITSMWSSLMQQTITTGTM